MYARQINSQELYTLSEVGRMIKRRQKRKRELFIRKAVFKLIGILCLLLCALVPAVCDGDCSFWLVLVPLAFYYFTRR